MDDSPDSNESVLFTAEQVKKLVQALRITRAGFVLCVAADILFGAFLVYAFFDFLLEQFVAHNTGGVTIWRGMSAYKFLKFCVGMAPCLALVGMVKAFGPSRQLGFPRLAGSFVCLLLSIPFRLTQNHFHEGSGWQALAPLTLHLLGLGFFLYYLARLASAFDAKDEMTKIVHGLVGGGVLLSLSILLINIVGLWGLLLPPLVLIAGSVMVYLRLGRVLRQLETVKA